MITPLHQFALGLSFIRADLSGRMVDIPHGVPDATRARLRAAVAELEEAVEEVRRVAG